MGVWVSVLGCTSVYIQYGLCILSTVETRMLNIIWYIILYNTEYTYISISLSSSIYLSLYLHYSNIIPLSSLSINLSIYNIYLSIYVIVISIYLYLHYLSIYLSVLFVYASLYLHYLYVGLSALSICHKQASLQSNTEANLIPC